jgi:hypothetical protein
MVTAIRSYDGQPVPRHPWLMMHAGIRFERHHSTPHRTFVCVDCNASLNGPMLATEKFAAGSVAYYIISDTYRCPPQAAISASNSRFSAIQDR